MASKSLNAGAATFTPGGPNKDGKGAATAGNAIVGTATSSPPPQASYNHDSFAQYAEMVETIEDIMDEESDYSPTIQSAHTSIETGLPPHLVNHAAEFWYPESRECTCCKGFKFGCKCVTVDGGGVCKFCGGGGASSVATAQAPAPTPSLSLSSMQQATSPPHATAAAAAAAGGGGTGFYGNQNGAGLSNRPSFNNTKTSYRPTHSGGQGFNIDSGGGGKRKIICKFFLSPSGCRNGAACTFEHVSQA